MPQIVDPPRTLNPFAISQHQFDAAADLLHLDAGLRAVLREPVRELHVTLPVRMDDGSVRTFKAFACSTTTRVARPRAASASIPTRRSTPCARSLRG